MKIKMVSPDLLKKYERNSRFHSEEQIQQIVFSIKEFGFTNPILVDKNLEIIAGHGRLEAAKILNLKEVPCIILADLSDVQKRAYVIADNKIALNSTWDFEILNSEIAELSNDFDFTLIGFKDEIVEFEPNLPDDEPQIKNQNKELILKVIFENEDEMQDLFLELRDRKFKVK